MIRALVMGLGLSLLQVAQAPDPAAEPPAPPPAESPAAPASEYATTVVGERAEAPEPADPAVSGVSATTVARDRLEALPGGDTQPVTSLVSMQPGVVQDSFGSNMHFRGADGALLYVIDGIPLLSVSVGTVGQLLNTIPTRLIQSVDIISGGFPVEYSYALGGVIDIRTRKPTVDPTGEIQLLYGTYDHVDVAANYAQQIGKFGILASVNVLSTERGLDTPDAITALNDRRQGGNAFLKLSYDLAVNDRLELIATLQEDKFHIPLDPTMLPLTLAPPGAVRGNDIFTDPSPPFVPYNAKPTDFERTAFAALSYVHTGDVGYQLSLYAREAYEHFRCDASGSLGATADPGSFCGNFTRDAFHFGALGNVTWQLADNHHWKAGIQIDEAPSTLDFSLFTRNDASPTGGPDPTQTLSGGDKINTLTGGVYIQDEITVGDFTLVPGLRLDMQNTTFGTSPLPNLFLTGPSVRLGASYKITPELILNAFAGYLWESPSNFDAPLVAVLLNPALSGQNPANMQAAKTWSGQIGLTYHPMPRLTVGIDGWGRLLHEWLDHQNIGNTPLWAAFNWDKGWAAGGDVFATGEITRFHNSEWIFDAFGNLSGQNAEQYGINTLQYIFPPDDVAGSNVWSIMDHVQFWTANVGLLLHDIDKHNNVSMRLTYGSGFHTGINNNAQVPQHTSVDVSLSHTFDPVPVTVAADVFNLFNDIYAYRLGTGYFGNSQYAPLRQFNLRMIIHLG